MIVVIVIILSLVLLVGLILVIPVNMVVDTDREIYRIYQHGLFSVRLLSLKDFRVEMRIVGIRMPLESKGTGKEKQAKPVKKREPTERERRSFHAWKFLARKIIGAIRVRKFAVDLDTNDYPLNAKLMPLFYFASKGSYRLSVNFSGRNYLGMKVSVRPISLAWAYLLFLTKQ